MQVSCSLLLGLEGRQDLGSMVFGEDLVKIFCCRVFGARGAEGSSSLGSVSGRGGVGDHSFFLVFSGLFGARAGGVFISKIFPPRGGAPSVLA